MPSVPRVVRWIALATLWVVPVVGNAQARLLAAAEPKDLIVGKWEKGEGDKKATLEFTKDGKLKASFGPIVIEGTYKLVGPDGLEITLKGPDGKELTQRGKAKVSQNELELIDPQGKSEKFRRVAQPSKVRQPGAKDLIVGKWEKGEGDKKFVLEFAKDGKLKLTAGPFNLEGSSNWPTTAP